MMNQKGRSMIEMLGVLAIIGVLSVGGLEGYSRAMLKHKLNKQVQQINTLIASLTHNYRKFQGMPAASVITSYFIKIGEVPQEMIKKDTSLYIYDSFNMAWRVFIESSNRGVYLSSYSTFDGGSSPITVKSEDSLLICKNILFVTKENSNNITHIQVFSADSSDKEKKRYYYYRDASCSKDKQCLKNMTLEDIYKICTDHFSDRSVFDIYWKY